MTLEFESLLAELATIGAVREMGRIAEISSGSMVVKGLHGATPGDRVLIDDETMGGEIVSISETGATILPEGDTDGIAVGTRVSLLGKINLAPDVSWLGRIVDPLGRPLDARPLLCGPKRRPLTASPPDPAHRRGFGARLSTGVAVFDTLLPLVRGQRVGLFAGSGVGKSSLLARLARGVQADVVVIALVGERGRELREFTDKVLGPEGMARSVVVTATSDQSPLMRRRCLLSAMTVAEHFRDQGKHVLLLIDSVTRFAEAHREVALAAGEAASLRGYPPSTSHALMSLCERAGPGADGVGDITAIFSVLVAGSDMEEPIADIIRGTIDGHVVLSRTIAERGRYPAVDLLRSVSRSLPGAATEDENEVITDARKLLSTYDQTEMMIHAGLYVSGSDPLIDRAIRIWPKLDAFLAEMSPSGEVRGSFERLRLILRG
ncbi:FliI/YscN family ATPase [Xinfangfangia sp. D13-10-4-6]|uniref:FliI/YscN family ATPase n=1 Tax=Pseudogemmobacter hezensis TaxID=2737662 RepID=UPI00155773DF|nr:FliI/YscN family ATPase [Pseudogemmobacter hezensis]NPD16958.1 FliI/YscN family ATPase [Pseudogemmobacter hezensis]